ncbi:putative VQ motif-containing protein/14 [Helianthus annuus]|nr:putative VQ motif-containing protein/14 [Helianthus annuus]
MDKSCHSSGEESSATNPNLESSKDQYLKQIHRLSHKISKPPIRKQQPPFEFDHHHLHQQIHHPPLISDESQPSNLHHNQQQHQPPVYNVSKSDFRDVVQKLTGSPAHERLINPIPPVKPQSSRLQKIRPPPLQNLVNRPPPAAGAPPSNTNFRPGAGTGTGTGTGNGNFFANRNPLSPLPPLPSVHAAAESPISAYMRCFQTNVTGFGHPLPPQGQPSTSLPQPEFPPPSSPLPFGCLPPSLSPRFPFSPTNQFRFQQLTPLSPTPPAPSPRWKSV